MLPPSWILGAACLPIIQFVQNFECRRWRMVSYSVVMNPPAIESPIIETR
jgi:hypothetical protein